MDTKRSLIKSFSLLLVTTALLFATGCKEEPRGDIERKLVISTLPSQYVDAVKQIVLRLAVQHGMTDVTVNVPETEIDISEISFAFPGTPTYGSNPKLEVFNPEGGDAVSNFQYLKPHVSIGDPTFFYTTANIIEGAGTDKPDLIAILPNIKTEICEAMKRSRKEKNITFHVWKTKQEIDLSDKPGPSKEPPVLKSSDHGSCVKTPSGLYFYQLIWKQ